MKDFKKLVVWQKAHEMTINLYKVTKGFPVDERFELTNQIQKSSVSIESNIAEGCGRRTQPDMSHFFDIAMGSASELECQLMIASDLKYGNSEQLKIIQSKLIEVKVYLSNLQKRVQLDLPSRSKKRYSPSAN